MKAKAVSGIMLTLLLTFTLSTSTSMCQSNLVEGWVPYVPFSHVDLKFWVTNGNWYMDVSITFPDSGFMIPDWGTIMREGCEIWVISEIWDWTGWSFQVITIMSHTYELGRLEEGNYTFTFMARDHLWDVRVKSINFTVVGVVEPTTWTVDDDGPADFHTIQEAINAANPGDTILVSSGTYYEHLTIDRSISLIGEDIATTIIDGNGNGGWSYEDSVVYVTADNIVINGFTIRNSGGSGYWSFASGICLASSNNKIVGNNITNNNYGIFLGTLYTGPSIDFRKNTIISNIIQNNNYGIMAFGKGNVITGNTVTGNNHHGIWFQGLCGNDSNTVTGNIVSNSGYGISLVSVIVLGGVASSNLRHNILQFSSQPPSSPLSNNTVSSNIVTGCEYGISISYLNGSTVIGNTIETNNVGLHLYSFDGLIYHNTFVSNHLQVSIFNSVGTIWDNGYPSGGNYWSDYNGTDIYSGPYQNETGSDGIGDTSYVIDADNEDQYPLMSPFNTLDAGTWNGATYNVDVVSNSTVSDFYFNPEVGALIRFNVNGPDGTTGFCRVAIPKNLLWLKNEGDVWVVTVDGRSVTDLRVSEDSDNTYLYFTYTHSVRHVEIRGTGVVPEFPTWTPILLTLILVTIAIAIHKRRLLKTPIH